MVNFSVKSIVLSKGGHCGITVAIYNWAKFLIFLCQMCKNNQVSIYAIYEIKMRSEKLIYKKSLSKCYLIVKKGLLRLLVMIFSHEFTKVIDEIEIIPHLKQIFCECSIFFGTVSII